MSVTVFCPNGRRQIMKVTPNTTILEILEFACEKQGLNSQEFTLFRNNKQLDLSLTIRFANIPNNGQLDLKPATIQRKDVKVTVALQLENGERKIDDFDCNQNLWDIVHQLFDNNSILSHNQDMQLCIIYMRREIEGEVSLKQTTLRSLGLTNGKVAMRLLTRPRDASKEQAFVESLNLKKPSGSKDHLQTDEPIVIDKKENLVNAQSTGAQHSSPLPVNTNDSEALQPESENSKRQLENNQSNSVSENVPIVTENISIATENIPNEKPKDERVVEEEAQEMEVEHVESSDESNDVINYLGGINSEILFKLSDMPKLSNNDIPDAFFEVTKDDLVYLLNDLHRQQVGDSEKSLETKQLREQREREKMDKCRSTVIRICFPYDKLVLQAVFKPDDNINKVMEVVRNFIKDKNINFYLYTTPPKQQLKPDSTLYQLKLVPAALIHFGVESSMSGSPVLKEELGDKVTSYRAAAKLALDTRKENRDWLPSENSNTIQNVIQSSGSASGSGSTQVLKSANDEKERKIPKWLKSNK